MSKIVVPFGDKIVILEFEDFDDEVNVDELTSIDYSNLFGEAVTVSALMNKIGILKSTAESVLSIKKLDLDIYIAQLQKQYRRESNINSGKFTLDEDGVLVSIKLTEDSLTMAISLDKVVQNRRKAVIESQKNLSIIDSLYWAVKSKDEKLSVLVKGVSPSEFVEEVVEGRVNSMFIKKKNYGNKD